MSIFNKIISGETPAFKVMEDDRFLAFLDIRPVKTGHTLVIPKKETDYLFDIGDDELGDLMVFAKKVSQKLKHVIPCRKVGVMVAGLEVPHAHVHLIPIDEVSDLNFANAKDGDMEELKALAQKLKN